MQRSSALHTADGMILVTLFSSSSGLRFVADAAFADTAKEIYRNATLRELQVLRTMDARGTQQAQALAQFNGQLEVSHACQNIIPFTDRMEGHAYGAERPWYASRGLTAGSSNVGATDGAGEW